MIQIINETFETWLTDDRLSRWNHIRHRSGLDDITKEIAIGILKYIQKTKPIELTFFLDRLG